MLFMRFAAMMVFAATRNLEGRLWTSALGLPIEPDRESSRRNCGFARSAASGSGFGSHLAQVSTCARNPNLRLEARPGD